MKYGLITADKIEYFLRTHTFGCKVYAYCSVRSTNEMAYKVALTGAKEGTLVISEEQLAGRGRMNRKWHSLFGKGLWFSLILRPTIHASKVGLYPYLAGVSVAQAIENKIGLKPTFKWPNDLLLNGRKFCGILSEVEFSNDKANFIILGIGINVNQRVFDFPAELRKSATSLLLQARTRVNRIVLLTEILYLLEQHYYYTNEFGFEKIIASWKKRSPRLGKEVHIVQDTQNFTGKFEDLDEDGRLLLRKKDGNIIKVVTGDFI